MPRLPLRPLWPVAPHQHAARDGRLITEREPQMIYQIVDLNGEVLGEFDDYAEANEWLIHIIDQSGPIAELRNISD